MKTKEKQICEQKILEYIEQIGLTLEDLQEITETYYQTKNIMMKFYENNCELTDDEMFLYGLDMYRSMHKLSKLYENLYNKIQKVNEGS